MAAVLKSNSMPISLEEVRHVAKLARLNLEEVEMLALQGELNALLGHFSDIQDIDVSGVEPNAHAVHVQNIWAEDAIGEVLERDAALRSGPLTRAGFFVVPTIIED